jgi:hypothetical protein
MTVSANQAGVRLGGRSFPFLFAMSLSFRWTLFGLAGLLMATGEMAAHENISRMPLPRIAAIRAVTSTDFMVTGEVRTRTDTSFTILMRGSELRTVQVTEDTAIVKGGATIKLSDLAVGDKVHVTLMRGGDGKLRAVNVTVRLGSETA